MKKKVLLTKPITFLPGAEEALGQEVEIIRPAGTAEGDIKQAAGNVHGIIASDTVITEAVIQAAPLLQVISTPQAGFDKIDVKAATKAGVPVIANAGLTAYAVAEFTLGLMIALSRRIVRSDRDLRQKKNWSIRAPYSNPVTEMGVELQGATIGVVGFGFVGKVVARACQSLFTARILAYDPFVDKDQMASVGVEKVGNLTDLAGQADFLTLHMALTPETKHAINEKILKAMKPSAFLINCARGAVVDETALIKALQEKWIAGVATDVFEQEPINPQNPLLEMANVIATPHIGGVTVQSAKKRGEEVVRRTLNVLAGKKPDGFVNPEVWPGYINKFNLNESLS